MKETRKGADITSNSRPNQQTVLMCFPSNEKNPCTDLSSLSDRQVPAVSHGLRKTSTTISNMSSDILQIAYIWKDL